MTTKAAEPVIVIDRVGYSFYKAPRSTYLSSGRFSVRLVTATDKLHEVEGEEIEAVLALPRSDHSAFLSGAKLMFNLNGVPARRIVAVTERYLLHAAKLREELSLPGMTLAETLPFRDKVLMKEAVAAGGLRVPEFAEYTPQAARDLLSRYKRVVAKPRFGAGSKGIVFLDTVRDADTFEQRYKDDLPDYEVEEFISGQLFHIDSIVDCGKVVAATAGLSIDPPSNFETSRPYRDVSIEPSDLLDELLDFNTRVMAQFPAFRGVTHLEVFKAEDGIYFCEIGARAGGGGVIASFQHRTGYNLDEIVLQSHLEGAVPASMNVSNAMTGYVMIYGTPGQLVGEVRAPDAPWVIETQILARPGEILDVPQDWSDAVCIVSVTGLSAVEVTERLEIAIEHISSQLSSAGR
ncbi:ATP-grasp domain-containing protein [Rhizobium multihospitium]|uniref:ATP-grasp domain-containing protein n=1 Tax=Rhizobium multihospitium TaxID=410764 RepID=A0A1C3XB38_9HYPH|nr:ATP-grasp domain-containing protein [Rhizobium multihospitium]SCB49507.1 ATP-grasp domain-containing protein [Rhizobium multihospitium]